jgi:phage protein D
LPFSKPWRAPAFAATVNGVPVSGLIDAEVVSTNRFEADRFRASIALGADPAVPVSLWSDTDSLLLALSVTTDGTTYSELIRGYADTVSLDIARGRIRVEGRDLTTAFLNARLAQTFPNRTASEIAQLLAANHGMQAMATPTTTLVGRYFQDEHVSVLLQGLSRHATEWDLLAALARLEVFNVYVSGSTLYFGPPQPAAAPTIIRPSDTTSFSLNRVMQLGSQFSVTVKSWDSRQATAITETVQSGGDAVAGSLSDYTLLRPNLTPDQARQLAQTRLDELRPHSLVATIEMPGDSILSPRDIVSIVGTGTSLDQQYEILTLVRSIGPGGFRQSLRAQATDVTPRP